jgi:hypothetical protein
MNRNGEFGLGEKVDERRVVLYGEKLYMIYY